MTKAVSTASLIVSVQALTLSKPLKRLVFTFGREFTGLRAGVNRRRSETCQVIPRDPLTFARDDGSTPIEHSAIHAVLGA